MALISLPLKFRKLVFSLLILIGTHNLSAQTIVAENALPGTPQGTWDSNDGANIQGFATDMSVNKGTTIDFKINIASATLVPYTVEIYRLGYYQGNGARFITNLGPSLVGKSQPAFLYDAPTGKVDCSNWTVSASWAVPANAVSGVYIARLDCPTVNSSSLIIFVVRDDAANSPVLFKTSDATWQAYNYWGGNTYYAAAMPVPGYTHATKVSYQRPLTLRGDKSNFFADEFPMLMWLERNGYEISYTTDRDMARDQTPITPSKHKVLLSVGHDEYWSAEQFSRWETARNNGVNLAFFSGNSVYWKTRWEDNFQTMVCYKEGTQGIYSCGSKCDPMANVWTGLWRDGCLPVYGTHDGCRPEGAFIAQMGWTESTGSIKVPDTYKNLRFWKNTTIASLGSGQTATLPLGTLGAEWDQEQFIETFPAHRIPLSFTTFTGLNHSMALYRHDNSGALVFSAGTMQWSWGLEANHDNVSLPASLDMQQATVNLLKDMGATANSLQAGIVPPTLSTDAVAPTTTILTPVHNTSVPGSPIVISGTTADNGGGAVGGVEVSTDNGVTWHKASGFENWTYSFSPTGYGNIVVKVRAWDDVFNLETPGAVGSSNAISITLTGPFTYSVFNASHPESAPTFFHIAGDIELGMKFRSTIPGTITGFRYYKAANVDGQHIGHLWTSTGTLLATEPFVNETASGWQTVALSTPVNIVANTTYVVSYFSASGKYTYQDPFFTTAIVNGPLRGLANGEEGNNGVSNYPGSGFPTGSSGSSNFYADVIFTSSDVTTPQVVSTVPANNATGVLITVNPSATFDEAVDPGTVTNATVIVTGPGNVVVPGTVSVNAAVITFTPTAQLTPSTVYTITLKGGNVEPVIKDLSGNALSADYVWSFTTQTGQAPIVSTHPASQTTCPNSSISFTSAANAVPAPTVKWQVSTDNGGNWNDIPGETNTTYTFNATLAENNNQYRTVWNNSFGTTNSNAAILTVAASITGTIAAVTTPICEGTPMQLQLTAATGPAPYSLTINGSTYTGINLNQPFTPLGSNETIWNVGDVPATLIQPDGNSIEVGVKFQANKAGVVKGIRFYKGGAANGGTHIGSLWTAGGTLLASATFTGETTSGWQEVSFSTPVQVNANTTYVASYYLPQGSYSKNEGYFTNSGHSNGNSLNALQSTGGSPNGVYAYAPGSVFPTFNGGDAHYWVDVVFTPYATTTTTFDLTSITASNGCNATGSPISSATITVLPGGNAGTISGTSPVCIGTATQYSTNGTPGGTWTSSNPAVATVDLNTGMVTAVSAGTSDITYSVTGCFGPSTAFKTITVNPTVNPGTVSGQEGLCVGTTVNFVSSGDPLGSWSSTNPAVATVNGAGVVNAVSIGFADIVYTINTGCFSPAQSYLTIEVKPTIAAGVVSGTTPLCIGATATYTSSGEAGGVWTSTNTNTATVNSQTGLVTALAVGTTNITYTLAGCSGPVSTIRTLTVNPNANAGTVSGVSPVCIGTIVTYTSDGNVLGSWSSTNTAVATVNPTTGQVTPIAAGTTDITYIVTGCNGPVSAFKTLTVDANVTAGVVNGGSPLCIGATDTYTSNGTAGGSWSSTNTGVATVNASTGLVTAIAAGTTDITYTVSGCGGPVSAFKTLTLTSCATIVNLKLFLQGYYIGGGQMQPVMLNQGVGVSATETDNITVELHDATTFATVATTTGMLNTDGTVSLSFAPLTGSYYIAIKHRNTLQTWSANPVAVGAIPATYDFTTAADKAFGDNMIQIGGVWMLYTGDLNQDDFIDASDYPGFDFDNFNGVAGVYVATDMNGDGFVDASDYPVFDSNNFNAIQAIYPQ